MFRVQESETDAGKQQEWLLSRNCALTPRQVGAFYLSLVFASAAIAIFFLWHGVWMILPFSVLEMVALGLALYVYARHAIDGERVSLRHDALEIESIDGSRRWVRRIDPRTVRIELEAPGSRGAAARRPGAVKVALVSRGERIAVGRFVCERDRRRFARELRQALSVAG